MGVVPVCDALTVIVRAYKPKKVVVLQDVAVLPDSAGEKESEAST
jgi:hypothetical protein